MRAPRCCKKSSNRLGPRRSPQYLGNGSLGSVRADFLIENGLGWIGGKEVPGQSSRHPDVRGNSWIAIIPLTPDYGAKHHLI